MGKIHILTTRHEEKMKPTGKIVPGSVEDQRLPLSYRGAQNAYKTGQDPEVVPPGCGLVIASRSTLMRTTHTLQNLLAGAGYNPDAAQSVQWQPEKVETGLACGYNFDYPGLPAYGPKNPQADNYVRALLENCFVPVDADKTRPVMAAMGYALLDSLIQGIETALPFARDGAKALVAQATHAPFIDALDAVLFETTKVNSSGSVTIEGWPGHYAMGQYIAGTSNGKIESDNPNFVFFPKMPSPVAKTLSLDELKRTRDKAYDLSQGRF